MIRWALCVLGLAIALVAVAAHPKPVHARCPYGCGGAVVTPTPAGIVRAFAYSCANLATCVSTGADPGPTPDQQLFVGNESLSGNATVIAGVAGNCTTPCQAFVYDQATLLTCSIATQNAFDNSYQGYLNGRGGNDAGYMHSPYPNAPSGTNRDIDATGQGSCNSNATGTGGTNQVWALDPLDTTGDACFYNALVTSSTSCGWSITGPYLPAGMGVAEDSTMFNYHPPAQTSTEYGQGYSYSTPNGANGYSTSLIGAWGTFYKQMCGSTCVKFISKYGDATTGFCVGGSFSTGHCRPSLVNNYAIGTIDNRTNFDPMCTTLAANRNYLGPQWEDPVSRNQPAGANDIPSIIVDINTAAYNLANHAGDACGAFHYFIEETVKSTYAEQIGVVWMVPDANGIPDVLVPWRVVNNGSSSTTDVARWIDYDVEPQGYLQTPAPYSGTQVSSSTWCEGAAAAQGPNPASGDTGGVGALVVYCPKQYLPILRAETTHFWIPGPTDKGPVAIFVNTSDTSTAIQDSWCHVACSSIYTHVITFTQCSSAPCEGEFVPAGYNGPLLTSMQTVNTDCTNASFCILTANAATAVNFTSTSYSAGSTQVPAFSTTVLGP